MPNHRYDFVVVGGGIGGLMTAARLAVAGYKVGLFEKGRLGSQASTSNHGMVHSGALYVELHPEIVSLCREATCLYRQMFPDALLSSREACFFAAPERIEKLEGLWEETGTCFRRIEPSDVASVFRHEYVDGHAFVGAQDMVVSSRRVLVELVLICLHHGADLNILSPVCDLIVEGDRAVGVKLSRGNSIFGTVLLCSGMGIHEFARRFSLKLANKLRSRLDMMVNYKGNFMERSFLGLELGSPTLAPCCSDEVLASLYGGTQPWVEGYRRHSVPIGRALEVTRQLQACLQDDVLQLDSAQAYVCGKTEVATQHADKWGVQPGFQVVDHGAEDGLEGLWTLIPGKMTLAFHASRALAQGILKTPVDLALPTDKSGAWEQAEEWVDYPPWRRTNDNW